MNAIPLEGGIGAASALKMAFGGWNKIGVALAAQAYAIARAYGVEDALAGEGVESDGILRAAPEGLALGARDGGGRSHVRRARPSRRHGPRGAADLFRRWEAHRDHPAELDRARDLVERLSFGVALDPPHVADEEDGEASQSG